MCAQWYKGLKWMENANINSEETEHMHFILSFFQQ